MASVLMPLSGTPLPVEALAKHSRFGSLITSSLLPAWVREALAVWMFPRTIRLINQSLTAERLGHLTQHDARSLYEPLNDFHRQVRSYLDTRFPRYPAFARSLLNRWHGELSRDADRLGDIVEALAWGADDELRGFIGAAISRARSN